LRFFYERMCLTFLRKPKELCQVDVIQLFKLSGI
jgi:hypothetical protein